MNELNLARRFNKRLFGVLVEEVDLADMPVELTRTWQVVHLAAGPDHVVLHAKLPLSGDEVPVTFSKEGLARLRSGLRRAGLHANFFAWPPENDRKRSPYRGLRPLDADDAGIFFGREAPIVIATILGAAFNDLAALVHVTRDCPHGRVTIKLKLGHAGARHLTTSLHKNDCQSNDQLERSYVSEHAGRRPVS